ncbi:zinc finger, HIT-type protein [Pseudohyphozyma bogoriensis]|nr:zinc finger, HIT-type protein [Pseudohyphozyma bogoriensis]
MASTSRAGLCAGCSNPAKYKCPRCAYPSCSLACSTAHKTATSCSGIALPVHAQAIQATEWGWGPMMRDQSYISSVSRKAEELGKQLAADKLLPARNAGEGRLDERNDKEDLLVREARAEGVDLVLLPKGMSRRARNASRWDYKGKKVDWTTEILLHPPSAKDPRAPPQQPLIVTNQPLPSTTTLYFLLKAAMDTRDRKGKGKELDEEDAKLRSEQKAWLETFAPLSVPQPAEAVEVPPADAREDAKLSAEASPPQDGSTAPSADPPFVILSPVVAIPPRISSSSHDDDELSTSTTAPPATSTTTPRPSSKSYYTMSPSDTLRKSLVGTTLIEYPTFEIWSREAFLRARALGAIAVAEKPESLPQLPQGAFSPM